MYKHILIPTDGSALSNEALVRSLQLAKTFGAAVTILTVEEPFHVLDGLGPAGRQPERHQTRSAPRPNGC